MLALTTVSSSDVRRHCWLVNPMISAYPGLGMPSTIGCQAAKTWTLFNHNESIGFAHAVSSHLI